MAISNATEELEIEGYKTYLNVNCLPFAQLLSILSRLSRTTDSSTSLVFFAIFGRPGHAFVTCHKKWYNGGCQGMK